MFGHFRLTGTNFAEKSGLVTTICEFNSLFHGVFWCIISPGIAARNSQSASESLAATLHPAVSFLCDTP
jgi:hypothetical protein